VLQQVSAKQAAATPSATTASKKTFTPLRPLQEGSNSAAADTPGTRSAIQRAAAAKPAIGRRGGVRTPLAAGPRCAVRDMLL
jgi:hypothetical protein